jgi:hypothetical protein
MPLRATYANQLNDPPLAANSINTFSTIQNLNRLTGNGAYVFQPCIIPVNYLKPGTCIRTEAWGTFTNASTTPTLVFTVGWGQTPVVIGATAAVAETSVASVVLPWHLYATTVVRNATVSSAVVTSTHGYVMRGTSVSAIAFDPIPAVTWATVNVDNTTANEWSVWATLSASSASNIVVLNGMTIEELTQI